ncbi:hypothetical protein ACHAWF_006707 [Thalassiosira exigua]
MMIRPLSLRHSAACCKRRDSVGMHRSARGRPGVIFAPHSYFSSEAADARHSPLDEKVEGATEPPHRSKIVGTKPKRFSFFDEVDEIMKRESPVQYQRFLESKEASMSRRAMQQRNEQSRRTSSLKGLEVSADAEVPDVPRLATHTPPTSLSFSESSSQQGGSIRSENELPWYKRISETSDFSKDRAGRDEVAVRKHEDEMPWYKQRNDMSEFAKVRTDTEKSFMTPTTEEPPKAPDKPDEIAPTKKKGVFASISESALNFKDADGGTSKVSLAELFPTLYANDTKKDESSTPKRPVDPAMMYDPHHFEAYQQALTAILDDDLRPLKQLRRFEEQSDVNKRCVQKVKDWLLDDHRVVNADEVAKRWNTLNEVWRCGKWTTGLGEEGPKGKDDENAESRFTVELKAQRDVFISKLFDDEESSCDSETESLDKSVTEAELRPLFEDIASQILGALGRYCARRARSQPMEVAWYKIKECGALLPKETIATYLYVVSTMGIADSIGMSVGIGGFPNKSGDATDESKANAFRIPEEVSTYHDLSSKPTESSVSIRVRALASKGDAKYAEELLEEFKKYIAADESSDEIVRLRTYLPIFKQYCDEGDVSSAVSVFRKMQTTPGVILEPENYVLLLATIAEKRGFCDNSPSILGQDSGYAHTMGPKLFDEIACELAEEALEITSASAIRLYNALAVGFEEFRNEVDSTSEDALISNLTEVHPLMTLPLSTLAPLNATGKKERARRLQSFHRQIYGDMPCDTGKGKENQTPRAKELLQQFSNWLDEREGDPFTAIVDGANVGYYMQSFDKGRFNYHQIKFMVDTLEERGENPLVIVPHKYGSNEFYSSKREVQRLDPTEVEIKHDLTERGRLYRVPGRCLDDFYWMLGSVADQTASRRGQDLSVPNNDPGERFPGARPMLITNDQMRDHRLELLEPRLFRRWCFIVNYNFTAFVLGESVPGNEIGFSPADFFSREIQSNACTVEDPYGWQGLAWHFPVNDWDLDERFCLRIPTPK